MSTKKATAYAPATVANIAVGFDILGFALEVAGDHATAELSGSPEDITLAEISGVVTELPKDPQKNTATVAVRELWENQAKSQSLKQGVRISLKKGIPLSSGMGGSAASAVAAVVAANALLPKPLPREQLLEFALAGEAAASGSLHGDNVAPCLLGGLQLVVSLQPLRVATIPSPKGVHCVLVHPHLRIDTQHARSVLKPTLLLSQHVHQSANLGGFLAGCFTNNTDLLRASLIDLVIEPQRAELIPGFFEAKNAAITERAIGFSISGSGPSCFAWAESLEDAQQIHRAVTQAFASQNVAIDSWIAPLESPGARIVG